MSKTYTLDLNGDKQFDLYLYTSDYENDGIIDEATLWYVNIDREKIKDFTFKSGKLTSYFPYANIEYVSEYSFDLSNTGFEYNVVVKNEDANTNLFGVVTNGETEIPLFNIKDEVFSLELETSANIGSVTKMKWF